MAKQALPIFDRKDHELLRQTLRKIHDLLPILDEAASIGLDVEALRQLLIQERDRLSRIEQYFMTPVPER